MKKISLLYVLFIFVMIGFVSCDENNNVFDSGNDPASSAPAPVPQTGQTKCWNLEGDPVDCTGTGQDGDIKAGVAWPDPRFTDNGNGTIKDNLTGLIWLKDMGCTSKEGTLWQEALEFANKLADGQCGLTDGSKAGDWYLPNVAQLASLVDYGFVMPALSNTAGTAQWTAGDAFANVQLGPPYWTSTTYALEPSGALNVSFFDGAVQAGMKTSVFIAVTAVRGDPAGSAPAPVPQTGQTTCWNASGGSIDCKGTGQDGDIKAGVAWPNPRFTDNGDGTIKDNLTGLVWLSKMNCLSCKDGWGLGLDSANKLADGQCGLTDSSKAGDWHLPNVNEYRSLFDFNFFNPVLSNTAGTAQWTAGDAFTNVQSNFYWSSDTYVPKPGLAWTPSFFDGGTAPSGSKSAGLCFTAVRGDM